MKYSLIYAFIFLSLYSCGTYTLSTNKGYEVKSILAITQAGDTISVPYRDFVRDRYDYYPRYQWNNNWYWNNWFDNSPWGGYNWWWNSNPYWNGTPYISVPRVRPKVQPRPRVPRLREPRPRTRVNGRRNETNTTNPRGTQQTQTRSNGRRSWSREVIPSQPARSRISTPSQPRQIRRGSQQPRIQQTQPRGRSSQQGSRSTGRRQN